MKIELNRKIKQLFNFGMVFGIKIVAIKKIIKR